MSNDREATFTGPPDDGPPISPFGKTLTRRAANVTAVVIVGFLLGVGIVACGPGSDESSPSATTEATTVPTESTTTTKAETTTTTEPPPPDCVEADPAVVEMIESALAPSDFAAEADPDPDSIKLAYAKTDTLGWTWVLSEVLNDEGDNYTTGVFIVAEGELYDITDDGLEYQPTQRPDEFSLPGMAAAPWVAEDILRSPILNGLGACLSYYLDNPPD